MNIASFSFAGFPGTNQALRNLSRTVRMSQHFSVTSVKRGSPELKFFAEHFAVLRPALLILGAWTPAYKQILDALSPATAVGVYWTSSPGQVDMSREMALLTEIMHHPRVRYVFFTSRPLAAAFQANDRCLELPLTFPVPARLPTHRTGQVPILSLFCSPNEYRRKNILNTLIAVARQTRDYVLYLNGLSEDAGYKRLLSDWEIRYHDWGWLNHDDYQRVLARVDIGLQVSFSESFGYVVTDHLLRGIPVLTSKMVPVMDKLPARVRRRLVLENADDPSEFGAKLDYLLNHTAARQSLANAARRQLLRENEANIQHAKTTLRRILEKQG